MGIKERIDNITKNKVVIDDNLIAFPKTVLVEVTNACNCNCVFCANSKMTRERGIVDKDFLFPVLKEAFALGSREVGFYTTGEPLLNQELEAYIKYSKEIGFEYIYITTNGILASIDRVKKLYESGLDSIKFSINAIDSFTYKQVHNVDYFDKVVQNLKDVYRYKKENNLNLKVYVSYIATNKTNVNRETIQKFFENICDDVVIVNVRNQSGMMHEISELLSNDDEKLNVASKRQLPCFYTFKNLIITKEGYLTACCCDFNNYLAYADLHKETLKDAWNNDTIKKLRQNQINNSIENSLCYNCIYNSIDVPKPLRKDLATPIKDDVFSKIDSKVVNFIKNLEG